MRPLEASREVGVSYRTASDWAKGIISSNGRRWTADGVLVWAQKPRDKPAREERVISARFLPVDERIEIADLHRQGVSVRQMAVRLGRSPSTVSRELRRNAHPGSGDYRPWGFQPGPDGLDARRMAVRRVPRWPAPSLPIEVTYSSTA
jgi:transposase, IS30 family